MSTQKTKAEEAIRSYFDDAARDLPGADAVGRARQAAIAAFNGRGLPHRRIEAWKYTDLRSALKTAFRPATARSTSASWQAVEVALGELAALDAVRLVLVDGVFVDELSALDALGAGVEITPFAGALADAGFAERHGGAPEIEQDHSVVALNTAFMTDGAVVRLSATPELPIHLIHVVTGTAEQMVSTRNVISVGDGVHATILESFVALEDAGAQVNALTHVDVGREGRLDHIKVQRENMASTHLSTWIVELGPDAAYRGFQFSMGAALSRNQIAVRFTGEGAVADLSGADLIRGSQHCDTTLVVDHAVPRCTSRELYKLVLDGRSRGVFQGKVIVRPDAQKTDGKQMAQALMLSNTSEFDSKPELEIYADDVVCGHGATCAEIDPDLVFYCRSRGMPEAEAKALITLSFIAEAVAKVENETIASALQRMAEDWLRVDRS